MSKIARNLLDWIGLPGDVETVWSLIKWIGSLSMISGLSVGYASGIGWGIVALTAVSAFGLTVFQRVIDLVQRERLDYKLVYDSVLLHGEPLIGNEKVGSFLLELKNTADFEIFVKLEECECNLNNVTTGDLEQNDLEVIIPPNNSQILFLPPIIIDFTTNAEYSGTIKANLLYGRLPDAYTNRLDMKLGVSFRILNEVEGTSLDALLQDRISLKYSEVK